MAIISDLFVIRGCIGRGLLLVCWSEFDWGYPLKTTLASEDACLLKWGKARIISEMYVLY